MSLWNRKSKKDKVQEPKKKLAKKNQIQEIPESETIIEPETRKKKVKAKEKKPLKKEKDDAYVMKKNTGMRVLRVIFWLMLILIFCRGVYEIMKPDKTSEVTSIINDFRAEQQKTGDHPEELTQFAQDFAKEYLTYSKSGEKDFKERIAPYVSKRVLNINGIYSFHNTAEATYVDAYRKEEYAKDLYDVYINAEIRYEITEQETGQTVEKKDKCTLKVPVAITENGYCVESLPLYVTDNRSDPAYNPQESSLGSEIDSEPLKGAITNFLDAYYSQDQSMIDYLLAADADQDKFSGLSKRYIFQRLESIRAYMPGPDIICILKVKIQDAINEEVIYQEFTVTVVTTGDKYYIKDMDSRVTNINYQEAE